MATGVGAGHLIGFVLLPVVTRLYDAEQFGTFGLFLALSSFVALTLGLRYEQSIVISESKEQIRSIFILCLFCSLSITTLLIIASLATFEILGGVYFFSQIGSFVYFIPIFALALFFVNLLSAVAIKNSQFETLSLNIAGQHILGSIANIILGFSGYGIIGLVSSKFSSLLLGLCILLRYKPLLILRYSFRHDLSRIFSVAKRFSSFPKYSLPNSMLSLSSRESVIVMLSFAGNGETIGFFVLARTLIYAPASLFSSVLGPILQQNFAENHKKKSPNTLAKSTILLLLVTMFPLYFLAGWNAEILFSGVFGNLWKNSSTFFVMLAPGGFLLLFNSWLDRIFEIKQKVSIAVSLQLVADILTFALVFSLFHFHFSIFLIILVYSLCFFLHQLVYFFAAIHLVFRH